MTYFGRLVVLWMRNNKDLLENVSLRMVLLEGRYLSDHSGSGNLNGEGAVRGVS